MFVEKIVRCLFQFFLGVSIRKEFGERIWAQGDCVGLPRKSWEATPKDFWISLEWSPSQIRGGEVDRDENWPSSFYLKVVQVALIEQNPTDKTIRHTHDALCTRNYRIIRQARVAPRWSEDRGRSIHFSLIVTFHVNCWVNQFSLHNMRFDIQFPAGRCHQTIELIFASGRGMQLYIHCGKLTSGHSPLWTVRPASPLKMIDWPVTTWDVPLPHIGNLPSIYEGAGIHRKECYG